MDKKSIYKKRFFSSLIVIFTLILLFYGLIFGMFLKNALDFTSRSEMVQKDFWAQQDRYLPLVTTVFDKAETVNVRSEIDNYNQLLSDESGNRRPVYFIRLKNGALQKLFQSGELKSENVDTPGERKVVGMIEGKVDPIAFPQYTCCGGDDIWSEIFPLNHILPDRRYLKDFPSELETILLIRDKDGAIRGAMVELHGD